MKTQLENANLPTEETTQYHFPFNGKITLGNYNENKHEEERTYMS